MSLTSSTFSKTHKTILKQFHTLEDQTKTRLRNTNSMSFALVVCAINLQCLKKQFTIKKLTILFKYLMYNMPKKSAADMVEVAVEMKGEKMMKDEKPKATSKKGGMTAMSPEVKEQVRKLIEKHGLDKSKAAKLRMAVMRGEKPASAVKKVL